MAIKIKEYGDHGRSMRRMLTAMIVSDDAAKVLCPIYDYGTMPDMKEISTIIEWCCEFYDEYGKAPKKAIQDIFDSRTKDIDEDEKTDISKFLSVLSGDYERIKTDDFTFVIHESKKFICSERRKYLAEQLKDADEDEIDDIIKELQLINRDDIDEDNAETYDPLDEDLLYSTIQDKESSEPMFTLPGSLGQLINATLIRGGFLSFQGEEKVGKTWLLMYIYNMALRKRLRVAFFQAGDMTSDDFNKRFISMRTGTATMSANSGEFHNVAIKVDGKVEFVTEAIRKTSAKDIKSVLKFKKRIGKDRSRVITYSNDSLNAALMENKLEELYQSGFVPDVVILDYADIMAPEPGSQNEEGRHVINQNWKSLRKLSQDRKILLITATQGSKESRDKIQSKRSGTEDKRKDSHITASFGLSNHTFYHDEIENNDCFQVSQLYSRHTAKDKRLALIQRELRKGKVYVSSSFVPWPHQKGS